MPMKNNDLNFIDSLLNQYEAEQSRALQRDSTVFEILGRTYDEDLISRMLAYTLKKDNGFVCQIISHCLKKQIAPCSIVNVECEKSMCGGRADIFIEAESASDEKYALTIENKIYSWEHDDQTETYYKYVSAQTRYRDYEKVFVYLKPNFNGSLPVCTDFHVVTYNQLLKWIDSPRDAKICDFKTHIQNNLISKEIEFMDTDTKVLENYTKLKQIIKNAESKFEEVKRQIVADIFTKNNIQGMDYNPNENHDKEWDAIKKGTLVIEVANFGSCYRVYRKDLWYHHTDDLKNKFYFFVELKFCDNDPTKILVQKLIKRYGQKAQESVIYKFLDANKDIIHDGNTWGVLDTEKFIDLSAYNILSAEWKSALKEKAAKFITEAVAEMDEIFGRFESWKNEKQ